MGAGSAGFGALNMLRFGLTVQFLMGIFLILVVALNLHFTSLLWEWLCMLVG